MKRITPIFLLKNGFERSEDSSKFLYFRDDLIVDFGYSIKSNQIPYVSWNYGKKITLHISNRDELLQAIKMFDI